MDEQGILERLAQRYRTEGFDVIVRPSAEALPEYLVAMPVDLIARKGDRIIAVKAGERGSADADPVRMDADFGAMSVIRLLREAERLIHPETTRAALVMAWAAVEGSARLLLQRENKLSTVRSDADMIERLWENGQLSALEHDRLQHSLYLRNAIVHGSWPGEVPFVTVPTILGVAKRLLKIAGASVPTRLGGASVTVVRKGINDFPMLVNRVERATELLSKILGPSRSSVSIDWDIAREMRDRPVIVLRLSDSTGIVSATFEPDELLDEDRLQTRLSRLWGDLLEIRSHKQVEKLLESQPAQTGEYVGAEGQ